MPNIHRQNFKQCVSIRQHSSAPPPSLGAEVLESHVFGTLCTTAASRAINSRSSEWARCALCAYRLRGQRVGVSDCKSFWDMLGQTSNDPEQWRDLPREPSGGCPAVEAAYWFPRARVTQDHGLGGSPNRNLLTPILEARSQN